MRSIAPILPRALRKRGRSIPAAEADLEPLFDFRDEKKSSMDRSGYTCGFFSSQKSNIDSTSTFSLRAGFPCFLGEGMAEAEQARSGVLSGVRFPTGIEVGHLDWIEFPIAWKSRKADLPFFFEANVSTTRCRNIV
jgi:hypothetical protein